MKQKMKPKKWNEKWTKNETQKMNEGLESFGLFFFVTSFVGDFALVKFYVHLRVK